MKWPFSFSIRLTDFLPCRNIPKKPFGLKAKITVAIIFIVVGVLFVSSFLDYHLTKKEQINLYLERNLLIAKQIDVVVPEQRILDNLPHLQVELEDWLLSRPSLMEIDIFLLFSRGWKIITSHSKDVRRTELTLSPDEINRLKEDKPISNLRDIEEDIWLEVIVPIHSRGKVIGGIRVVSSLDEAHSYLSKKRGRTYILTISSILVIFIVLSLFFRNLVGNPIQKMMEVISRAEKGDLEAKVHIRSQDELGELGRHLNRMLKTIRETNDQNIQLLSQVNQFNEELKRKIEIATSELAKRNEELRLINEALFESQRQLSRSEKLAAVGQVTATLAHQIGTPLNSISGYIELMLQEESISARERDRLRIIESQLDRLTNSVKNILSFTRQPRPQLRPLHVNNVLEELIHLSEPWFLARNVKVTTSLSSNLPHVLGDPMHLQTLFLNVIANAIDAMPNGGRLTIKTKQLSQSNFVNSRNWVEISIADTGIGITEESKKRIFDPFYTTKNIGEGTGLGLAICESIIKQHSGRLEVMSEVGEGSTFFVFIPVSEVANNLQPASRLSEEVIDS